MLDALTRWNRWGNAALSGGYRRDVTASIEPYLNTGEVVALVGLRRAGKTTVLYQIMDMLEAEGVPQEACFHMNFEEPALGAQLSIELLDALYRLYREEVFPTGTAYLFFDEIQNVPGWERWVRARNETEEIKIFITGSSAALMSRELATVLTGRHVEFYVAPFSFSECLRVKGIDPPKKNLKSDPPAIVQKALTEYMSWGGFPEVVLSDDVERKERLLRQYFDDILFKDVAVRHEIRDLKTLRNIAVHLITQSSCLFSVRRVASLFQISQDMAAKYCDYIQESFLVDFLPFFSLKASERNRNPKKAHVNDLGLRRIASVSLSMDYGKLAETLVHQHIKRTRKGVSYYWKGKQEIDFVIQDGNSISECIQVAYDSLDDDKTRARELNSLDEVGAVFPSAERTLVVGKMPDHRNPSMVPLWWFLL